MHLPLLLAVLGAQAQGGGLQPADTIRPFGSPAARELVHRVIRESGDVPGDLLDYSAGARTTMHLAMVDEDRLGGEQIVTAEQFVSELHWHREADFFRQRLRGYRVWLLTFFPETPGREAEDPWIIPHLYGRDLPLPRFPGRGGTGRGGRVAVNPFGEAGPSHYSFALGDTTQVQWANDTVTVVQVLVRPRRSAPDEEFLVAGSFGIDLDRAAVVRARFGFVTGAPEPSLVERLLETGIFLELRNGLWDGRFWLPYEQRWDVQLSSIFFDGTVGLRVHSSMADYRINDGWAPREIERPGLTWATGDAEPFSDWPADGVAETGGRAFSDFDDLRRLLSAEGPAWASDSEGARASGSEGSGLVRLRAHWDRSSHLVRYNRVEGLFLGAGVLVEADDPVAPTWDLYGSAGWAIAERTSRGEVVGGWNVHDGGGALPATRLSAGLYRRLSDTRSLRLGRRSDMTLLTHALLSGYDVLDYYDASGTELQARIGDATAGWRGVVGLRRERHRPIGAHTDRYLFGTADDFPPIVEMETGTHTAVEAEIGYLRGGAGGGIGPGWVAGVRTEVGVGDFRYTRTTALLHLRAEQGPFVVSSGLQGGHTAGDPPSQVLFRFGGDRALRGYERGEFGGTSAVLARARVILPVPPLSREPLATHGRFLIPPLRPALVVEVDGGWSKASRGAVPRLDRLGAVPTGDLRGSVLLGVSVFDDTLELGWAIPLESDRSGGWRGGFVWRP